MNFPIGSKVKVVKNVRGYYLTPYKTDKMVENIYRVNSLPATGPQNLNFVSITTLTKKGLPSSWTYRVPVDDLFPIMEEFNPDDYT